MEDVLTGNSLQELLVNCIGSLEDTSLSIEITSCIHRIDKRRSCSVIVHIPSLIKYVCVYTGNFRPYFAINTKSKNVNFDDVWPEIELMLTFGVC